MNLKNMKPNKLTIEIEDGIINSIFESDLTTIILEGKKIIFENSFIIPGIVDSHAHIIGLGENLNTIRLENAKSKNELLKMVKQIDIVDGWICGRGWN